MKLKMQKMAFDVLKMLLLTALRSKFLSKKVKVETGVTPLTNYNGVVYDIFNAIGDFMGETLSDDFTNVTGTGPITWALGGGEPLLWR